MIDGFPWSLFCAYFARLSVDAKIYLSISARQEGRSSMHSALKAQSTALMPVKSGKAPLHVILREVHKGTPVL